MGKFKEAVVDSVAFGRDVHPFSGSVGQEAGEDAIMESQQMTNRAEQGRKRKGDGMKRTLNR